MFKNFVVAVASATFVLASGLAYFSQTAEEDELLFNCYLSGNQVCSEETGTLGFINF